MSYRLTPRAVEDIDAIAAYIHEHNPAAATKLIRSFIVRWELLAEYPYAGVGRDDILPGIRHFVLGSYLALYSVVGNDVLILRVLHGRREITDRDVE